MLQHSLVPPAGEFLWCGGFVVVVCSLSPCPVSLGEVGISVLFVADGRTVPPESRRSAQLQSSMLTHFPSCRASCGEDEADLGFSSWSGSGSSQAGLDRVAEHIQRPSW